MNHPPQHASTCALQTAVLRTAFLQIPTSQEVECEL